jgi:Ala-tRNA(Pro) deacylase
MSFDLYTFLESAAVEYERHDHPPVFTCEEASRLVPDLPGSSTKNLFVRDRKGKRHFLIVVPDTKAVDLAALEKELESSRLSMGSAERLERHLGIEPGSVSLLALFNDKEKAVEAVIDKEVWEAGAMQCHPLVNTSTLVIPHAGVVSFLEATGRDPRVLSVPEK